MEKYDSESKCYKYFLKVTRTFTRYQFGKIDENIEPTPQIDAIEYEIKKGVFEFKDINFEILDFVKDNHNHITEITIKINALKKDGFTQILMTGTSFKFKDIGTLDASLVYEFEF